MDRSGRKAVISEIRESGDDRFAVVLVEDGCEVGVGTTWTAENDPQLAAIRRAVQEVLRLGLRPAKIAMAPDTFVLADPEVLLNAATPLEVAWSVEERCLKALDRFGDGPAGAALRLLLGASAQSRSLPLKTRRRLAAEEVDVYPETFRKLWERGLVEDLLVYFVKKS